MKLVDLKCSNCGAVLSIIDDGIAHCDSCGSNLHYDNGKREWIKIDVAELLKLHIKQEEFERQKSEDKAFADTRAVRLKQRKLWLIVAVTFHIICAVLMIAFAYVNTHSNNQGLQTKLISMVLLLNLICPVILSITRPFVPKQAWDQDESGKIKQFFLLLVTGIVADIAGAMISAVLLS
ncbi:MAG: hypothetical protein J6I47_06585 [Ruminococcus sp.]|nr:hypothetical protein [Ruminococcus sp.]